MKEAWKWSEKDVTHLGQDDEGKLTNKTFILACAATPAFILNLRKDAHVQRLHNHVQTPSGTIKTRQMAMILVRVKSNTAVIKAIVHNILTKKLLRSTPLIDHFGPILLTKKGVSIVDNEDSQQLHLQQRKTTPIERRSKNVFIVTNRNKARPMTICL